MIEARIGFDWERVRWGVPADSCGYCGAAIPETAIPLVCVRAHHAAVFCHTCMAEWFGFEPYDADRTIRFWKTAPAGHPLARFTRAPRRR